VTLAAASPEIVLTYAEARWRARGLGIDVGHEELRGLEGLIEAVLARRSGLARVAIRFDFTSMPAWMRQYQSHYFNYVLRLEPRCAGSPRTAPHGARS